MVLVTIVTGVVSQKDMKTLGRISFRIMAYYVITTLVACAIGILSLIHIYTTHKCVQKDEMAEILDKMVDADVIVLATPAVSYTHLYLWKELYQTI